ncbi:hypothetical protein [Paracoccus sp. (in: a-proteobacteria)]|uniref:hypothetical protein n=1 Tax=Paracoccus sp. TaxID=267 RepID=UPI0028975492|nr:hypothetical protein [Paracoccus sp. (in: a-proteobacteria)]
MAHYRSDYRAQAMAALTGNARFSAFTAPKVWSGSVDVDSLPVLGVLTPQEGFRMESFTTSERKTLMQIAIRRAGGDDVEDILDEDSAFVEALVTGALRQTNQFCFLRETSIVSNADGAKNIGTLVMGFEITSLRPPAALPETP